MCLILMIGILKVHGFSKYHMRFDNFITNNA